MANPDPTSPVPQSRSLLLGAGSCCLAGFGIATIGWLFDVSVLKRLLPDMAILQWNAALGFGLIGIALISHARTGRFWRFLESTAAALLALVALATLIEYLFQLGLDLDQVLPGALERLSGSPIRGRASWPTELCFLFFSGSFFLLNTQRWHWLAEAMATIPAAIGILALTGEVFQYSTQGTSRPPPLPAVVLILAVTFALLGADPNRGLAALVLSPRTGGVMARRLLPAGIFTPFLLGFLWLLEYSTGAMSGNLGLALYVLTSMIVLSGFILWYASILNRLDEKRARVEAEVSSSREMLQLVLDTIPQGIFWKDRESRHLGCNAVVARAFGLADTRQIVGLTNADLQASTPEQAAFFLKKDREVIESDTPQRQIIEPLTAADGRTIWLQTSKVPMHDSQGRVIGLLGSWEDITERKLAESELRTSEERFRGAFEHTNVAMVLTDSNNRFIRTNVAFARLFGYSSTELLTMSMADITHPDDVEESYRKRESLLAAQGTHFEMEKRYLHKNGRVLWGLTNVSLIRDGDGRPMTYVGQVQDITKRKEAEAEIRAARDELEIRVAQRTEELAAANKELEAFSYSISHDLRAPLRAIDGFSRIVLEDYSSQVPAEGLEFLRDIRANTKQMGRLVDDLLAFAHLGRKPINRQTVSMSELVFECLRDLKSISGARDVETRVGDLESCEADPALLKQVWMNLLGNALKFSSQREHAVIEVGSERAEEGLRFFVRDNGVGFDMRYAHKLFGVFQRLHRAEDYEGTGVGLAIVQRVIQRHGGRVWAESQPDSGASFFFSLPKCGDNA